MRLLSPRKKFSPGVRDPLEDGEPSSSSSFRLAGFSGVRTSAIGLGERFSDCELPPADSSLEASVLGPGSGLEVTGLKNLVMLAWPDILRIKKMFLVMEALERLPMVKLWQKIFLKQSNSG